ncbi:hypothetical protein AMJ80_04060 [bacterium SM23_31]|nr:MAG: hypothetical protein AMJ80_04060 [bacterium SM23_31]
MLGLVLLFSYNVSAAVSQLVTNSASDIRVITLEYESVKLGPFHYRKVVQPKLGIALSGGGLRGFAQIGVLDEFEKAGIPVDYIAGSSMGSIVGGLYAIGYSPTELEQLVLETNWEDLFFDAPERSTMFVDQKRELNRHLLEIRFEGKDPYIPQAISQGQQISTILNSLILRAGFQPHTDFNEFRIPLRVVATNILTGEETVFKEGNLALAILASISVPLLFSPVKIDGSLYWDAGLTNNIPTDVARSMGSDIVVTVNTTAPLRNLEQMHNPWEHVDQVTTIMEESRNKEALKNADVVIAPDLGDLPAYDSEAVPEFIALGREAARKAIPEVQKKLREADKNNNYSTLFNVGKIKITGNARLPEEFINRHISTNLIDPAYDNKIKNDLKAVFATGYFKDVMAVINTETSQNNPEYSKTEQNSTTVEYRVIENPVIKTINITGNTVFSQEELQELYVPGENDVFNHINGEKFILGILEQYNQKGYSLAQVIDFNTDPSEQTLSVRIDEGRISGIQVIGNNKTQPHVIKREMPIKAGDIFDFNKVQRGINNIYGMGLFQRVYPTFAGEAGRRILQINLEEKKYEIVRFGARYDLDKESKGFIELADDNFGGLGMKSLLHARYGSREEDYRYQFRLDRIFVSYLTMSGDFHYTSKKDFLTDQFDNFIRRGDFKDTRFGGSISFGRQLSRFGTVSVKLDVEKIKVEAFPSPSLPQYMTDFLIYKVNERVDLRTITLQSMVDTRNKYPFPSKGNFHEIYYETATPLLGSKISYVKFYSSLGYVYTFNNKHTVEPRVVIGFSDETLPYAQRFRWGGLHTFFGKRLNSLHGRMIVASNLGYRFKLPLQNIFDTYIGFRWDLANVVEKNQQIKFKDFKHAFGAVASMNTPIGPIELGYGVAFNDTDRIYFSLGYQY